MPKNHVRLRPSRCVEGRYCAPPVLQWRIMFAKNQNMATPQRRVKRSRGPETPADVRKRTQPLKTTITHEHTSADGKAPNDSLLPDKGVTAQESAPTGDKNKPQTPASAPEQPQKVQSEHGTDKEESPDTIHENVPSALQPGDDTPGGESSEEQASDTDNEQYTLEVHKQTNDSSASEEKVSEIDTPHLRRNPKANRSMLHEITVYLPQSVADNCALEADYNLKRGRRPHRPFLVMEARVRSCPFPGAEAQGRYHIYPLACDTGLSLIKKKFRVTTEELKNIKEELEFNLANDSILETQSHVLLNRIISQKFTPPAE